MTLKIGDPAPPFRLPADDGGAIALSGLRGRKVVLYFYPKADTASCTTEAQDFSRLKEAFEEAGTTVIGVSRDPVKALGRFRQKHDLGIALATDEAGPVLEAYGVWAEKSMYGRTFMGIERSTFLVDAKGRIARIWRKVRVKGHAEEVLAAARAP